jgi:rare lipoprotein A
MGAFWHSHLAVRLARVGAAAGVCLALANCAAPNKFARKVDPKYGVPSSERVVLHGEPVPKGGGTYRVGKPYVMAGQTYTPEEDQTYANEGLASWYGDDFHGRRTANGEVFDMDSLSAAHPTLPMPSYVRVTNLNNRRSVILRVNDRGPYAHNRVIDVSRRAAHVLGFHGHGVARVRVEYVGRAALQGSDDRLLTATLREGEPAPIPSAVRVASSRSFVPQMASSSPLVRGPVPVPQGRPYELGEPESGAPSQAGTQPAMAARFPQSEQRDVALAPRTLDEQARSLPPATSAFAPVRYDGQSGRSLY